MPQPKPSEEYERGYSSLWLCILGGALLNSIGLCMALYAVAEGGGWPAWLSLGYCIGGYLVLYVLNVVGKAALMSRDMLIEQYREKLLKSSSSK